LTKYVNKLKADSFCSEENALRMKASRKKEEYMMELNMSQAVINKLAGYDANEGSWLLDLDDGVGPYSKLGICSLDTSFRLLLVSDKEIPAPYTVSLSSAVGPIYIKDYTVNYFDQNPKLSLNERFQSIMLETESGVVDRNVELIDLRK
jgi:uncharacterized protein YqkB